MLGVGLHSYGFMASAVFWLMTFIVLQLVMIAIGLAPQRLWRSSKEAQAKPESAGANRVVVPAT